MCWLQVCKVKLSISDVVLAPTLYKGAFIYCSLPTIFFAGIFTMLIFFLQCYSKYGEVVQGLTRFFRDKATSDPLKLKQTDCNGKGLVLYSVVNFFICLSFLYASSHTLKIFEVISSFLILNLVCLLMI